MSWAAGRVLDQMFPDGGKFTLAQLSELIRITIHDELEAILNEHELTGLGDDYQAALETLKEYNQSGGVFRVQTVDTSLNTLIAHVPQYGERAAELLASAQCLKILNLQTMKRDNILDTTANLRTVPGQYGATLGPIVDQRLAAINRNNRLSYEGSATR